MQNSTPDPVLHRRFVRCCARTNQHSYCTAGGLQPPYAAPQVAVRKTRRIEGDHVLTAHELLQPVRFDDAIAAGAYPIDIHPAAGAGLNYQPMGEDHAYQIPYRSLIPVSLDNALAAGRGLSATPQSLHAHRVMTISTAVGSAGGRGGVLGWQRAAAWEEDVIGHSASASLPDEP